MSKISTLFAAKAIARQQIQAYIVISIILYLPNLSFTMLMHVDAIESIEVTMLWRYVTLMLWTLMMPSPMFQPSMVCSFHLADMWDQMCVKMEKTCSTPQGKPYFLLKLQVFARFLGRFSASTAPHLSLHLRLTI